MWGNDRSQMWDYLWPRGVWGRARRPLSSKQSISALLQMTSNEKVQDQFVSWRKINEGLQRRLNAVMMCFTCQGDIYIIINVVLWRTRFWGGLRGLHGALTMNKTIWCVVLENSHKIRVHYSNNNRSLKLKFSFKDVASDSADLISSSSSSKVLSFLIFFLH